MSEVSICNKALARIGQTKPIASLAENTKEGRACALFYASARDAVLGRLPWPFATVRAALVAAGTPPAEWGFSYAYPSDCLRADRIDDGLQVRRRDQRIPYSIEQDTTPAWQATTGYLVDAKVCNDTPLRIYVCKTAGTSGSTGPTGTGTAIVDGAATWDYVSPGGLMILTDQESASLVYVKRVTNTTLFPLDFEDLVAWRLAVDLAMPLAVSEKLEAAARQRYVVALQAAAARALNEISDPAPPDSEFLASR